MKKRASVRVEGGVDKRKERVKGTREEHGVGPEKERKLEKGDRYELGLQQAPLRRQDGYQVLADNAFLNWRSKYCINVVIF